MNRKVLIKPNMPVPSVLQKRPARRPAQMGRMLHRNPNPSPAETGSRSFTTMNHDDIISKPEGVQKIWSIIGKIDPSNLLLSDDASVFTEGGPEHRSLASFDLNEEERRTLKSIAILDCKEQDEDGKSKPDSAVGSMVSVYQLVELAYLRGKADEIAKRTSSILASTEDDLEDDFDNDDDFEED